MSDGLGLPVRSREDGVNFSLVYPMSSPSRIAGFTMCVFFGAAGVALLAYVWTHLAREVVAGGLLAVQALAMILGCAWGMLYCCRARITIQTNTFEFRRAFTTTHLKRADIMGRRYNLAGRGGTTKYPVVIARGLAPLVLHPVDFELDRKFDDWFLSLPDLDAKDRASMLAVIANDASLGSTARERLARLDSAKKFAVILSGLALTLCMWVLLFPRPYQLSVSLVVALPWLAALMIWMKPNLYQVYGRAGDVRGGLIMLVLVPPVALGMRALFDVHVLDVAMLLGSGAAVAALLFVALMTAPRRETAATSERREMVFVMLPFLLAYGVGATGVVNKGWDKVDPDIYQTIVTGKRLQRGRGTTYHVELSPWRKDIEVNEFTVSSSYYYSIEKGGKACVFLHPGSLGIRWMQLASCE